MHAVPCALMNRRFSSDCCKLKAGFFKGLFGGNVSVFDQTSSRTRISVPCASVHSEESSILQHLQSHA